MFVKVKANVAIIGSAVNSTNPMSHGAMKTYPQRARRQASPEKRGRARGRATLGATIDQLPPASQAAWISPFIDSISVSRFSPGVVCHFVPYLRMMSKVWLYAGVYDSKFGTSA